MTKKSIRHTVDLAFYKGAAMEAAKRLQVIPGIGKSLSKELVDLGYQEVTSLKGEDPEMMYQELMRLRGHRIDRCVLYAFRCAVYYAENTVHDPRLLRWWNWKDAKVTAP